MRMWYMNEIYPLKPRLHSKVCVELLMMNGACQRPSQCSTLWGMGGCGLQVQRRQKRLNILSL